MNVDESELDRLKHSCVVLFLLYRLAMKVRLKIACRRPSWRWQRITPAQVLFLVAANLIVFVSVSYWMFVIVEKETSRSHLKLPVADGNRSARLALEKHVAAAAAASQREQHARFKYVPPESCVDCPGEDGDPVELNVHLSVFSFKHC